MRFLLAAAAGLAFLLPTGIASGGGWRLDARVTLVVAPSGPVKWHVRLAGICKGGDRIDRLIGTNARPAAPSLHLHGGRFRLVRSVATRTLHYRYTLTGHRTGKGYAGTFRYTDRRCDSMLMPWTVQKIS